MEFVETYWLLLLIVAALAIAIAWYVFHAARRTRVSGERRDVLDEGAKPAARNQALIDVPSRPMSDPAQPAVTRSDVTNDQGGDDLSRIKGLGPKLAAQLQDLGIVSFAQIAEWSETDIDRIDGQLGRFAGRIRRDGWVEQARFLARGDEDGFAARFGAIS